MVNRFIRKGSGMNPFLYMNFVRLGSLNVMTIHVSSPSRFGDKISKILFKREIDRLNIIRFFK